MDQKEFRETTVKRIIESVKKSYGHIEDASIEEMLCLRISAHEHAVSERNETLNLNARQAQKIARLDMAIKDLLSAIDGEGDMQAAKKEALAAVNSPVS